MNRLLAIIIAGAVAGCLSYSPNDAISDGGLDPNTFYVPGTDTPLPYRMGDIATSEWRPLDTWSLDTSLPAPDYLTDNRSSWNPQRP
jgi:hypothetical protein